MSYCCSAKCCSGMVCYGTLVAAANIWFFSGVFSTLSNSQGLYEVML